MSSENETLSKATRSILLELAKFLLQNNIGHREFATMSRSAFAQAGTEMLERNGQFAQKPLLELTGLSRSEIDRAGSFENSEDNHNKNLFKNAMRVLHKWHTNPDLLNTDGSPRKLDLNDPTINSKLFSKSAKISDQALISELQEAGSIKKVSENSWEPITRHFIPGNKTLKFHYFGQVTSNLVRTLDRNINGSNETAWIERGVSSADLTYEARAIFARVGKERVEQFLSGLDDWTASNRRESEAPDESESTIGFSIFYFED